MDPVSSSIDISICQPCVIVNLTVSLLCAFFYNYLHFCSLLIFRKIFGNVILSEVLRKSCKGNFIAIWNRLGEPDMVGSRCLNFNSEKRMSFFTRAFIYLLLLLLFCFLGHNKQFLQLIPGSALRGQFYQSQGTI